MPKNDSEREDSMMRDRERVEAKARELAEERRNEIVERAEDLMVEIYAAPPVIDQTSAAEQVLGVEEALGRRAEAVRSSIAAFRSGLALVVDGGGDSTEDAAAADENGTETKGGNDSAGKPPLVAEEERESLYAQAQLLVEDFQKKEAP